MNFLDFRRLAGNWLQDETACSIDDDNDVDIYDLTFFANEWLWQDESQMQMIQSVSPQIYSEGSSTLILTSASDSLSKRPLRLIEKTQKFYNITPSTTISAKQKELASIKNAKSLMNAKQTQITMQSRLAPAPVAGVISAAAEIQIEPESIDVNGLLNWLDDMWQNDAEIRNSMTEQEYLEFRTSIEQSNQ